MEKIKGALICIWLMCPAAMAELTCNEFPGLWWGRVSDATGLILDRAVPVFVEVKKLDQDWYAGRLQTMDGISTLDAQVWMAQCHQGRLFNMRLVHGECGIVSDDEDLAEPLDVVLNWQSAMMDARLVLHLTRLKHYDINAQVMPAGKVLKTCH